MANLCQTNEYILNTMKKIIAIFATVALATSFLAGCGDSVPPDEGPEGDGEEVGAEPGEEENLEGDGGEGGE
tara:strand:+ start:234 stop:449 length:216 start_codon:yes stop_codon:yes gene_type:complete